MPSRRKSKNRPSKAEITTFAPGSEGAILHAVTWEITGPPENWPVNVSYSTLPVLSPWLDEKQQKWLRKKPAVVPLDKFMNFEGAQDALPLIKLPVSRYDVDTRILVRRIDEDDHPAFGQFGIFASRKLSPGDLVIPYIGYVHGSTTSERKQFEAISNEEDAENSEPFKSDQILSRQCVIGSWDTSDYDLNMVREEELELAVDAAQLGNEARFCNDYRGVPLAKTLSNQQTHSAYERNSKRTAKCGNAHDSHQPEPQVKYMQTTSIPNAEFRDVWFEWFADAEQDKVADLSQEIDSLEIRKDNDNTHAMSAESIQKVKSAPVRKRKVGMRGVAIFVLPAGKSGKRKHGIPEGHEILVSYGKGFWAHH